MVNEETFIVENKSAYETEFSSLIDETEVEKFLKENIETFLESLQGEASHAEYFQQYTSIIAICNGLAKIVLPIALMEIKTDLLDLAQFITLNEAQDNEALVEIVNISQETTGYFHERAMKDYVETANDLLSGITKVTKLAPSKKNARDKIPEMIYDQFKQYAFTEAHHTAKHFNDLIYDNLEENPQKVNKLNALGEAALFHPDLDPDLADYLQTKQQRKDNLIAVCNNYTISYFDYDNEADKLIKLAKNELEEKIQSDPELVEAISHKEIIAAKDDIASYFRKDMAPQMSETPPRDKPKSNFLKKEYSKALKNENISQEKIDLSATLPNKEQRVKEILSATKEKILHKHSATLINTLHQYKFNKPIPVKKETTKKDVAKNISGGADGTSWAKRSIKKVSKWKSEKAEKSKKKGVKAKTKFKFKK